MLGAAISAATVVLLLLHLARRVPRAEAPDAGVRPLASEP
jgi:hypothetical protein